MNHKQKLGYTLLGAGILVGWFALLPATTKSSTTVKKESPKVEVEIENEIKQNPKRIELTNEIKKLSHQLETLSRKIKSLEVLIKPTYIKEKPRTIQNTRPVVTRKTRPLKEFNIGEIHPEDINGQSLPHIEVPKARASTYRNTTLSLDNNDTQIDDMGNLLSTLSGIHFKIAKTRKAHILGGPAFVEITILNVGGKTGYHVRCHVFVIKGNTTIDEGSNRFNNGEGIAPGQYSKQRVEFPRISQSKDYDRLEFKMFWNETAKSEVDFQVITKPRVIRKIHPTYPVAAMRDRMGGVVVVEFTIGLTGLATNIQVAEPIGFGFDEATVEAIKKWRFTPAMRGSTTIPMRVRQAITFSVSN